MELKIVVSGDTEGDLTNGVESALASFQTGNITGFDSNDTGDYSFDVSGEPVDKYAIAKGGKEAKLQKGRFDSIAEAEEALGSGDTIVRLDSRGNILSESESKPKLNKHECILAAAALMYEMQGVYCTHSRIENDSTGFTLTGWLVSGVNEYKDRVVISTAMREDDIAMKLEHVREVHGQWAQLVQTRALHDDLVESAKAKLSSAEIEAITSKPRM